MDSPPKNREAARRIWKLARENPLLNGTLVSEDGKALYLYIPITSKDLAYKIRKALRREITIFSGSEQYYITGLPVAEDTFGVEMFVQMAISAPVAMILIFLLMLFFFRKIRLIVAPLIMAMVSVICTMGLLIGSGNTLHIMSSMIPIFLMSVSVVDSIHILSEFFDEYQKIKDRQKTIEFVFCRTLYPHALYLTDFCCRFSFHGVDADSARPGFWSLCGDRYYVGLGGWKQAFMIPALTAVVIIP